MNMNLPSNPKDIFHISDATYTELSAEEAQEDTKKDAEIEKWETTETDANKAIPTAGGNEKHGISVANMKEAATDAAGKLDFRNVTTNLQSALQSSARFVLPGGQQFFYKNPIFNNNGDLIVEARYKS
jgi:hypothetical protein